MRWQDENPIEELVQEGAGIKESYLTVARVSEHRKEAQIGSQAIANAYAARDWLDHVAEAATRETGEARLRLRLWRPDRTAVRSVQTRV